MPCARKFIFILYLVFQFFFISSFAQLPVYWSKNIGGTDNDNRALIELTPDGGFIVAGNCRSSDGNINISGFGQTDALIVKFDSCGKVQWQKKYGGSGTDNVYALKPTPDNGYIFAGYSNSSNGDVNSIHGVMSDFWIVKLDAAGNVQWKRAIGGYASDRAECIVVLPGGNYIIAGTTLSLDGDLTGIYGPGGIDGYVVCLNSVGNTIWQKKIGSAKLDNLHDMIYLPDNTIAGCGFIEELGSPGQPNAMGDVWVFKMDVSGNMIWNRRYGGTGTEHGTKIITNNAGELIVCSVSESNDGDLSVNYGAEDIWIFKANANGDIAWQLDIGGNDLDYGWDITMLADQSFVICGETRSADGVLTPQYGQGDAFLVSISNNGQLLWKQNYGGSLPDLLFNVRSLPGNTLIASGISGSSDHDLTGNYGSADMWLIKFKDKPSADVDTTVCNKAMISNIELNNDTAFTITLKDRCGYDSAYINYAVAVNKANVKTIGDTTIQVGQAITLLTTASGNVVWEPQQSLSCLNCNNPVATPIVTTEYIVKAQQGSCIATDTVKITVEGKNEIYIPSAFSPNADGLNDTFKASGYAVNFTMQIYNRWGNLVFSSRNIAQGWNGFYKGKKQPSGSFVYVVTYTDSAGKRKLLKGNLVLIK